MASYFAISGIKYRHQSIVISIPFLRLRNHQRGNFDYFLMTDFKKFRVLKRFLGPFEYIHHSTLHVHYGSSVPLDY